MITEKVDLARERSSGADAPLDRERNGGHHLRQVGLGPDALLDDGPDPDLGVAAAREEEPVVLWVERKGSDVVRVLEDGQAVGAGRVPETSGLEDGWRDKESQSNLDGRQALRDVPCPSSQRPGSRSCSSKASRLRPCAPTRLDKVPAPGRSPANWTSPDTGRRRSKETRRNGLDTVGRCRLGQRLRDICNQPHGKIQY